MRFNELVIALVLLASGASPLLAQRVFATIDPTEVDESIRFDVNNYPVSSTVQEAGSSSSTRTIDLNYSPNIVFSSDPGKAFVSYPGSDRVMAFDPRTGTILKLLEVGANPGQIAITPDKSRLAVAAIRLVDNLPRRSQPAKYVATVSVIDVETLERTSFELSKVQLSLANNLVILADGKTGVVASMGTDELVRFDLDKAAEIGSRLKFVAGSRPASITPSPDQNTLAVVLIGSTILSRVEHPDSVALVDPSSLALRKLIAPVTGPGSAEDDDDDDVLIHDFTAANTFSFSSDGKFGAIVDQQVSQLSSIPELSFDRLWIYDFENSGFLDPVSVGAIGAATHFSPLTGEFVTLGNFEISLVDPVAVREAIEEDETIPRRVLTPVRSDFRPRSGVAFAADRKVMYLAAPLRDSLLAVDLVTEEIKVTEVGGDVVRQSVEGEDDEALVDVTTYTSAPLDVALAPAGDVIALVNFNANNIQLIHPSYHSFVPGLHFDTEFLVGAAVANFSNEATTAQVSGFYSSGADLQDFTGTEDVNEYPGRIIYPLESHAQQFDEVEDWLQAEFASDDDDNQGEETEDPDSDDEEDEVFESDDVVEAWIDLDVATHESATLLIWSDLEVSRLELANPLSGTYQRAVLPIFKNEGGWTNELFLLNPNLSSTKVEIDLVNQRGQVVESAQRTLASRSFLRTPIRDPDTTDSFSEGIYLNSVFESCPFDSDQDEDEDEDEDEDDSDGAIHCGFEEGYLTVQVVYDESDEDAVPTGGFAVSTRLFDDRGMGVLNGFPVNFRSQTDDPGEEDFERYALFAAGPGTSTLLSLVNPTARKLDVGLRLVDTAGASLTPEKSVSLLPGQQTTARLAELFSLPTDRSLSGWLLLHCDSPQLVGAVELSLANGGALTLNPVSQGKTPRMMVPHLLQNAAYSSGLALFNPSAGPAVARLEVRSPAGDLLRSTQVALDGGKGISRTLGELFPGLGTLTGGSLEVMSDVALVGLASFFKNDLSGLSLVRLE